MPKPKKSRKLTKKKSIGIFVEIPKELRAAVRAAGVPVSETVRDALVAAVLRRAGARALGKRLEAMLGAHVNMRGTVLSAWEGGSIYRPARRGRRA